MPQARETLKLEENTDQHIDYFAKALKHAITTQEFKNSLEAFKTQYLQSAGFWCAHFQRPRSFYEESFLKKKESCHKKAS